MKYLVLILIILPSCLKAQEISFTLDIPADSFLMHNAIELSYSLKNIKGWNMHVEEFEDFDILSGPNYSSNFSMINGEVSQSQGMTFFILPNDSGQAIIPGAQVETEEGILKLEAIEVVILANPEEKEMNYRLQHSTDMDFNFDLRSPAPKKKKPKGKVYKI
jgi:hypothetical protein